jgi:pyrroline-5-carboxylate reductase
VISLSIIGCGNMGRAFAEGLLRAKVVTENNLYLVERRKERREQILNDLGLESQSMLSNLNNCKYLLLAVKPQDLSAAAESIRPVLSEECTIISILAGTPISILQQAFVGHNKIVRAMPNLPAIIGSSMSAYYCSGNILESEKNQIKIIFKAIGETLELQTEELLNAVTALSGSGPAYLYYIIDAWTNAALELGFSAEEASLLIEKTLRGSIDLWATTQHDHLSLQQRVASKGGTTEAAISIFDQNKFKEIFITAISRAHERAEELEALVRGDL